MKEAWIAGAGDAASPSCKVSVILPVYNMAGSLPETLDSVLRNAMELGDTEVIVVDDGSLDASFRVACVYGEKYPGVVRVYSQPNAGSGPARNLGMSEARGEYIAFMDADDFYPEDTTLSRLYRTAREQAADLCGGSLAICDDGGHWMTEFGPPYEGNAFREEGWMDYADYQYDYAYYRFLFRRAFLQAHGLEFPDLLRFQDVPFFVRVMAAAGRFYAVKDVTYVYRRGGKRIRWTARKAGDMLQGMQEVLCLAEEKGYGKLYGTACLHYRDYARQGAFLEGMREEFPAHGLFLSWLAFVKSLDKGVLEAHGIQEECSVRGLAEQIRPYIDVNKMIQRIKEERSMGMEEAKESDAAAAQVEEAGAGGSGELAETGAEACGDMASPGEAVEKKPSECQGRSESDVALLEAELAATRLEVEDLRARYNAVGRLLLRTMKPGKAARLLREERDWMQWFSFLEYVASRYLVVLAVKDTPGNDLPAYALRCILDAGFDQFRTDLWRTYIGVIHRGKALFQGWHENEEPTEWEYESLDRGLRITAASRAWRQGNAGDIFINGEQRSANSRGVNIVVYDAERGELVDSIGFDAHVAEEMRFVHWDGAGKESKRQVMPDGKDGKH